MRKFKESNFNENTHCWVCGKEIDRKDGNAKIKEYKKNHYVVYCHACSRDEEENGKFLKEEKIKQKKKIRTNLLRGVIVIVAIALWEYSKRIPKWEQIIWLGGFLIVYFLFVVIDEVNK